MKVILFLILFSLPFGVLTRLPALQNSAIHIYFQDVLVFFLAIFILAAKFVRKQPLSLPPLAKNILIFILFAAFSLIFNSYRLKSQELFISSLYLIRWIFYSFIYLAVFNAFQSKHEKTKIIYALILAGSVSAVLGILQYFLYPNLRNLSYLGWDPHQYRIFGTFLDAGFMGAILVLNLILITWLWFKRKIFFKKYLLEFLWFLSYFALMLTYSRSSYLSFIVSAVLFSYIFKNFRLLIFVIVLFIFSIIILPRPSGEGVKLERVSTINARFDNYFEAAEIIRKNYLFGVGFNTYRYQRTGDQSSKNINSGAGADASLLFVWATTGVFGLIAYLHLWFKSVFIKQKFPRLILLTTAVVFVHGLFLNSLFYPWVMIWVYFLWGISHSSFNRSSVAG